MKINVFKTSALLALLVYLGVAVAQNQDQASGSQDPTDSGKTANSDKESKTATNAAEKQALQAPSLPEVVDEVPEVPKEIQHAIDNQDKVRATMERFIPTEKLSEDRAVAFPNDI